MTKYLTHLIYPFLVILKFGWYQIKRNDGLRLWTYRNLTYNFGLFYVLWIKWSKYIFKLHLQRFHLIVYKLCAHRFQCVETKNSSITEEQVSRNLLISTLFTIYHSFFLKTIHSLVNIGQTGTHFIRTKKVKTYSPLTFNSLKNPRTNLFGWRVLQNAFCPRSQSKNIF